MQLHFWVLRKYLQEPSQNLFFIFSSRNLNELIGWRQLFNPLMVSWLWETRHLFDQCAVELNGNLDSMWLIHGDQRCHLGGFCAIFLGPACVSQMWNSFDRAPPKAGQIPIWFRHKTQEHGLFFQKDGQKKHIRECPLSYRSSSSGTEAWQKLLGTLQENSSSWSVNLSVTDGKLFSPFAVLKWAWRSFSLLSQVFLLKKHQGLKHLAFVSVDRYEW